MVKIAAVVLLVLAWAGLTDHRVAAWQNDRTLWGAALAVEPASLRANLNYAYALDMAGDQAEALPRYLETADLAQRTLRASPYSRAFVQTAALTDAARLFVLRGQVAEARDTLRAVLTREPQFAPAWYGLAMADRAAGDCLGAFVNTRRAQTLTAHVYEVQPCGQ